MSDAVPGAHPHQDMLSDLVADALPAAQAREVELHVMACPECEGLLADAEGVRALLASSSDPGPMPDDVWARIAAHLTTEATQQTRAIPSRGWFDADASDSAATNAFPVIVPVPSPPPALSFDEAPTAAWKAFLSEPPEPPPSEPVQQRVGRAVRSMRSRRDVRTEAEPSAWWTRRGLVAAAAAATVGVLGLGGFGVASLLGDDDSTVAQDALPGASDRTLVHASGVDYTPMTLAAQVTALVRTGSPGAASPASSPPATSGGAESPARSPARSSTSPQLALTKPGTVADPKQLSACLTGLGDGDRQVLAVDLARYKGREAAVVVLAGLTGGYDVWVVARDCKPGAEGTLAFKQIPA